MSGANTIFYTSDYPNMNHDCIRSILNGIKEAGDSVCFIYQTSVGTPKTRVEMVDIEFMVRQYENFVRVSANFGGKDSNYKLFSIDHWQDEVADALYLIIHKAQTHYNGFRSYASFKKWWDKNVLKVLWNE